MSNPNFLLLFILNCLVCNNSFGQEIEIRIDGKERSYKVKDSLSITITNRSDTLIFADIGLEKQTDSTWGLANDNIFRCLSCKHSMLLSVNTHESERIRWSISLFHNDPISSYNLPKRKLRGTYRFRVNYYKTDPNKRSTLVSQEFNIK